MHSNTIRYTDVIVLDDDEIVHHFIGLFLGVSVRSFYDTDTFIQELSEFKPIAFFIDVYVSQKTTTFDLIPQLKKKWPTTPVIVMTGSEARDEIKKAVAAGADDFIQKPLNKTELVARFKARTFNDQTSKILSGRVNQDLPDLSVDADQLIIKNASGKKEKLSITELNLLNLFISNLDHLVSRETIKEKFWNDEDNVTDNAINRHIHSLRSKIRKLTGQVILETVYKKGFILKAVSNS